MMGLTTPQAKILAFIKDRHAGDGVTPSLVEMAVHLGLSPKSKGTIFVHLSVLEEKGLIRRMHNRARSIEVIGPDSNCPHCLHPLGSPACFRAARAAKVSYSITPLNAARQ